MEKKIRITAICGWAIDPEWFRDCVAVFFPIAEIRSIYPHHPDSTDEANEILNSSPSHLYIGYSLGSLWLLHHRKKLPASSIKALLAPILAFTKEREYGGKVSVTQLKYLIKLLKRNPGDNSALKDFYALCNFPVPESLIKSAPDHPSLIRGLEFLSNISVPESSAKDFIAIVGEDDNFLDPVMLKCKMPQLDIVAGAGHGPQPLLNRLAQQLSRHKT